MVCSMARKSNAKTVTVQQSRLEERLVEQLNFLQKSMRDFDAGDTSEFRRMSVALRILLHKSRTSSPLVEQVGLESLDFVSYATPLNSKNLISEFCLSAIELRSDHAKLVPILGTGPIPPRNVSVDTWKNEPVLRDDHRHVFSRWDIVLAVANQDGGAHVDGKIDEAYHRLANENSIGFVQSGPNGEKPIEHIEKTYVRHISWEALQSIENGWTKLLGNRPCRCDSGRKARYCCRNTRRNGAEKRGQPPF